MSDEGPRGDKADLSAEQARAEAPARLPRADGDCGRPKGAGAAPGQGPQAPERLTPGALTIERLKKRAEFLFVRHGKKAVRPSVIVEARRRSPAGRTGAGFTATSKIGNAVIRNRAKRRLREAARALLPQHGLAGVDYVFVARASTPSAPWTALLDDVGKALISVRADMRADKP
jgi:ribonuclease P protein component